MLHSLQRSAFLRPRERFHELLALQQIAIGVVIVIAVLVDMALHRRAQRLTG